MGKLRVAILFGGRSVEHGVSINSARNIFQFIDRKKFIPVPIGLSQKGKWYLTEKVDKQLTRGKPLSIVLDPARPALMAGTRRIKIDVAFPVLHGTDGEDGSIQGLLKSLDIPLVGTEVLGSSLAINKIVSKKLMKAAGIPVADFITTNFYDKPKPSFSDISIKLGVPFMVKSSSLGSSIGVAKVSTQKQFEKALDESFRYDDDVLFEKFVKGRELECAILGNTPPEASLPGEIIIGKGYDFYTFDAKYVDPDAVKIVVPADVPGEIAEQIRRLSVQAFVALKCNDYARVDLFLTADNNLFINEINTIPGFTNASMFPMMWKERGISFQNLITRLVRLCMDRHRKKSRVKHDFSSALKF